MPVSTPPTLQGPPPTTPASGALQGALPGGIPAATEELRDILPPVEVPFWTPERMALALGGALLFLVLVAVAVWYWQKRVRPVAPPPDPRLVALEALQRLSGPEGESMSALEFVVAVTDILRRFLEGRHAMAASKQTSEEFLENLERSNQFSETVREQLRRFLGRCDAVKFAAVHADREVRHGLVFETIKLVKEDLA